jgi:hypothetical protein
LWGKRKFELPHKINVSAVTKTLDPMVLKVTRPDVVLPLVGVNRAFAEGPSICVAQPDSMIKEHAMIILFIPRSQN